MTSIRINFTNGGAVTTDPTFTNQLNDSTLGVKSADLLDIAGASTGVSLEVTTAFSNESGAAGSFTDGSDIFPSDTLDYYWFMGATTASIVFSGLPATTVVAVKGIGASPSQTTRDTVWDVDGQQQTYDAGGGASSPNPPVNFTTTQSDGSGNLQIDLSRVSNFGYLGALELVFTPVAVTSDSSGRFNSTLNYTTSGLGTITSATLTDSESNVMTLSSVTDTTAVIPNYGEGQRCLTGVVTLTVSDGSESTTVNLALLPKSGYQSVALETGFTSNISDWTYGWAATVGTEGQWTHPTIVLMADGSITGVTESGSLTNYVTDPSDGVMSVQVINFTSGSPPQGVVIETSQGVDDFLSQFITLVQSGKRFKTCNYSETDKLSIVSPYDYNFYTNHKDIPSLVSSDNWKVNFEDSNYQLPPNVVLTGTLDDEWIFGEDGLDGGTFGSLLMLIQHSIDVGVTDFNTSIRAGKTRIPLYNNKIVI